MVYSLQLLLEYVLHGGDILEGDGAFLEIAFCHLRIDNLVYQVADALFRIFGQAARGCLYGIRHHQDGLLLAERVGTGIGE